MKRRQALKCYRRWINGQHYRRPTWRAACWALIGPRRVLDWWLKEKHR
jgi:hypothetical protein